MQSRTISIPLFLIAVAILLPLTGFAAQGDPWFDLENCSMCKTMTAEEGLMENMVWENYLTADGMMTVTVVDPAYEAAFQKSMLAMQAVGAQLAAGEEMYLCGFCQSYGGLVMAGADLENFDTAGGFINLISSQDPAVVEMIHAHGQRTIDEYDLMVAAETESGHAH